MLLEKLLQRATLDHLHRIEFLRPARTPAVVLDDIRMLQLFQNRHLALEADGHLLIRHQVGRQHLDGHERTILKVLRPVDDAHAPHAQLLMKLERTDRALLSGLAHE